MSDFSGQQPYDPSQQPYDPSRQPYDPTRQPYGPGPQQPYGQLGEVPLPAPLYGATIGQAVKRFWKKYATFSGRASRSEFWWWVLVSYGVTLVLGFVNQAVVGPQPQPPVATATSPVDQAAFFAYLRAVLVWAAKASVLGNLWWLVQLVGLVALSVRRLHDTNRSGWWTPLYVIPLVGQIVMIVFWASAPRPEGQRYDR